MYIKGILLCLAGLLLSVQAFTQVRVGIKAGLATTDIAPESLVILDRNDAEKFQLEVEDAKYGFHMGFFLQAQIGTFFIQPEVLFNSNTVDYRLEDLQGLDPAQVRDENYQYLDMPVLLGAKFGPLRLGGGPVAHLFLDSTSDLMDFEGYEQSFDELTLGWQAGVGLDIWKLHIDARYEGNFTDFGEHIVFYGRRYSFNDTPSRMIASIGLSF